MANIKITALTNIVTVATNDVLPIVDIDDLTQAPTGTTKNITIAQLTTAVGGGGGGSVTSVAISGGTTGLTVTGSPITTSGTITLQGTLIAQNGGTGITSYAVGDILYADTTTTLTKLVAGSNGQILALTAGVPSWITASGTGTVTSASVVSANGFAGTVATATTTPAITLTTTVTGILSGNGTAISGITTSAGIAAQLSDETGTGALVFANTPTLVTPILGVATATSLNKVTITAPTTSATLTLIDGSSLITSGAFATTLTSTATTNVTLPTSGTLYGTATGSITSAQLATSLTDETGTGVAVFATTPTLVTPILGVATATSINKLTITAPATSATLTIADGASLVTSGAFSTTLTATATTTLTLPTTGTLATLTGTETFTNKAITKRVSTIASSATPTPVASTDDELTITALATNATFASPGAGTEGQLLLIRVKDDGTPRTLAFNAIYAFSTDLTAPTTTTTSKTLYMLFIYNTTSATWNLLAKLDNF